jgi:hypothetical protein
MACNNNSILEEQEEEHLLALVMEIRRGSDASPDCTELEIYESLIMDRHLACIEFVEKRLSKIFQDRVYS